MKIFNAAWTPGASNWQFELLYVLSLLLKGVIISNNEILKPL